MMRFNKLFFLGIIPLLLVGCSTNNNPSSSQNPSSPSNSKISGISGEITSNSQGFSSTSGSIIVPQSRNKQPFRISEIYDCFDTIGQATYKVFIPYTDSYTIGSDSMSKINVFDANGNLVKSGTTSATFDAQKDEILYLQLEGNANRYFTLNLTVKNHEVELPYQPHFSEPVSSYETNPGSTANPLKPSELKVNKRVDNRSLYVNCNNPEIIFESSLNKVLCGQDVTNKDVFFTFEHNNQSTSNFYYGYRVTNEGNEDAYITVKNLGLQIGGAGSWLGEDEWIKFYNLPFRVDKSKYTNSQINNFNAYVGFNNSYLSNPVQPITYRIPAGKYIYVMGGTKRDSFQKINVFSSADKIVRPKDTGCSNGAVLFSTYGSNCYGRFMAYTDVDASTINETNYVKQHLEQGYSTVVKDNNGKDRNVGAQYCGYDDCHGVVDSEATWIFNDITSGGSLPVKYTNDHSTSLTKGDPFTKIPKFNTLEYKNSSTWSTHCNPNNNPACVGTDMTYYKVTSADTGKKVTISPDYFDGRGSTANIGNWMVDYLDHITLVNQGSREREVTYKLKHNGVILAFVRDENGEIKNDYPLSYKVSLATSEYGAELRDYFEYKIKVPAHSVVRYVVDYNLLANSSGYIEHGATLND